MLITKENNMPTTEETGASTGTNTSFGSSDGASTSTGATSFPGAYTCYVSACPETRNVNFKHPEFLLCYKCPDQPNEDHSVVKYFCCPISLNPSGENGEQVIELRAIPTENTQELPEYFPNFCHSTIYMLGPQHPYCIHPYYYYMHMLNQRYPNYCNQYCPQYTNSNVFQSTSSYNF